MDLNKTVNYGELRESSPGVLFYGLYYFLGIVLWRGNYGLRRHRVSTYFFNGARGSTFLGAYFGLYKKDEKTFGGMA